MDVKSRFCRTQQEFGNEKKPDMPRKSAIRLLCLWWGGVPTARAQDFLWSLFSMGYLLFSAILRHQQSRPMPPDGKPLPFIFPLPHLPSILPIFRPLVRNGNFPAAARLPADFSCSYSLKQSGGGGESSRRREAWREGASFKRRPPSKVLPYYPNLNGRVTGNSECDER